MCSFRLGRHNHKRADNNVGRDVCLVGPNNNTTDTAAFSHLSSAVCKFIQQYIKIYLCACRLCRGMFGDVFARSDNSHHRPSISPFSFAFAFSLSSLPYRFFPRHSICCRIFLSPSNTDESSRAAF